MATAQTELLRPDSAAVAGFLLSYIGSAIQLLAIEPDGTVSARWFGSDVAAATNWAIDENLRGYGRGIYFSVNAVRAGLNVKAKKADITEARLVHVDIDPKKGIPFDIQAVLNRLDTLQCPPSWVIASGGGLGAYWTLEEPIANLDLIEKINVQVRDFFGADACHNIDRVMRVPGTVNFPNRKKIAEGRQPAMAYIVREDDGVVYRPDVLAASFPAAKIEPLRSIGAAQIGPYALITSDDLGLDEFSPLRSLIDHPRGDDRSRDAYACAGAMKRAGFGATEVMGILMNPANAVADHILGQRDPRYQALRCIEGTATAGNAEPEGPRPRRQPAHGEGETAEHAGRLTIHVRGGDLHLIASEAETALIAAGAPIYIRSGLVRPIVDDVAAAKGHTTKVARLKDVDADTLVDRLSRAAVWTKYDARSKSDVPIDPPIKIANTILAREGEWHFLKLAGVITTPTLRPDGTILATPGYDEETRLLLLDPPALPEMAEKPSREDAERAIADLCTLLEGFPFVEKTDRSVALSALITPVVRGAVEVVPMHATTAPVRGSGKSYIFDIASAVCSGQRAPVMTAGRTDEETEKRIVAAMLTGQALISIDNVNGQLGGDFLCQAIERPIVEVRPLGGSDMVRIDNRATFFATGNNIQLVDDMTRRVVLCSLDPNMEKPEFRTFSSNPFQMVLADRGRYIAAALTITRAYIVAGRPGVLPPLASFEDWSNLVRSALVWLGCADPIETMEKANAEDPGRIALSALLNAWYAAVGTDCHTTGAIKEVSALLNPLGNPINGALADALQDAGSDDRGVFSPKRFGRYLGRHHNRIVDGLKLIAGDDTHAKQKTWKVVRA